MALIGSLIVGVAALAGLLVGGVYGLLAGTCLADRRSGSRSRSSGPPRRGCPS